jgi:hypothetical protein
MSVLHLTTATIAPVVGSAGYSNINTGPTDTVGGLLNVIDNGFQYFGGGATPAQIDDNGIPKATLTAGQEIGYGAIFFNSNQITLNVTKYVFKWKPTADAVVDLFGWPVTIGINSGCTVAGSTFTITGGADCRVEFTFNSSPGANGYRFRFLPAAYGAGSPKPVLCRVTDEAAITAGKFITDEYIAAFAGLNLKTMRFLNFTIYSDLTNGENLANWNYRTKTSMLGWNSDRFYSSLYGGTATGTNQYTVARPSGIPTADWVDGETVQATITNASTSSYTVTNAANNGSGLVRLTLNTTTGITTGQKVYVTDVYDTLEAWGSWTVTVINGTQIDLQGSTFTHAYTSGGAVSAFTLTVTGKTNGVKAIGSYYASVPATILAGLATFVYNKTLDMLMYTAYSGAGVGLLSGYPIEVMMEICNRLNVNMWYNFPTHGSDAFATSLAALVRDGLNSDLSFYVEYSNETWNPGFPSYGYSHRCGQTFGVGSYWGWTGLRFAQISSLMSPVWTSTGRSSATFRPSIMWQAFGGNPIIDNQLNGVGNDPTNNKRLCTYLGGTWSGTCSGAPNYSNIGTGTPPHLFATTGGYAVYISGPLTGSAGFDLTAINTAIAPRLQTLATNFASDPNHAGSIATLDDDIRQGVWATGTISSVSGTTITAPSNGTFLNQEVVFYNTGGTLPSPLTTNKVYFVVNPLAGAFSVSATRGGSAISLTGGSGTHSFGKMSIMSGPDEWIPQTQLQLTTSIYRNVAGALGSPGWEGVAAGLDAVRATAGKAPLRIELYEGALEGITPTAAQLGTMGVTVAGSSATAATALAAGLVAYKNSASAQAMALNHYKQFIGTDNTAATFGLMVHSKTPTWFYLSSPVQSVGRWSLLPGPIGSTPFKMYNGIASFIGVSG